MRVLVIGNFEKELIRGLIAKADAMEPIDAAGTVDNPYAGMENAPFTIDLSVGYAVTLTRERQPKGLFRHISVSVDRDGKLPHPIAVETILSAFDMAPLAQSAAVWVEQVGDGFAAINVLQREGDPLTRAQ